MNHIWNTVKNVHCFSKLWIHVHVIYTWAKVGVAILNLDQISRAVQCSGSVSFALSHSTLPPSPAFTRALCPWGPVRPGVGFGSFILCHIKPGTIFRSSDSKTELIAIFASLTAHATKLVWRFAIFTLIDFVANRFNYLNFLTTLQREKNQQ